MAYGNIGNALDSLSRYDEAIEYHKKELEIAQQTGLCYPIRSQYFENLISVYLSVRRQERQGQGVRQHRQRSREAQPLRRGPRVPQENFGDLAADW